MEKFLSGYIEDEILEDCPLCGQEAGLLAHYDEADMPFLYSVKCTNMFCGCRTGLFQRTFTAINVWNRRTK